MPRDSLKVLLIKIALKSSFWCENGSHFGGWSKGTVLLVWIICFISLILHRSWLMQQVLLPSCNPQHFRNRLKGLLGSLVSGHCPLGNRDGSSPFGKEHFSQVCNSLFAECNPTQHNFVGHTMTLSGSVAVNDEPIVYESSSSGSSIIFTATRVPL